MNKFKKMMSATLADCMAASTLMMSAGAANIPVQQDNPNIVLNADWGKEGSMIDRHGVDWSKIDTSCAVLIRIITSTRRTIRTLLRRPAHGLIFRAECMVFRKTMAVRVRSTSPMWMR